jgi:hypothetical protein
MSGSSRRSRCVPGSPFASWVPVMAR